MNDFTKRHQHTPETSSDRSFGLVFAIFFLIVALVPALHDREIRSWALIPSVIFALIALFIPFVLAPLNRIWTKFGELLHRIVSPVALGILFFGVVVPTGLLMRIFGKDPLSLRLNNSADTYWVVRTPPGPVAESLKNQF